MIRIGIREIKNRLSEYLPCGVAEERIESMIRERQALWGGGKPRGSRKAPKIKGRSVFDAVIEDLRCGFTSTAALS